MINIFKIPEMPYCQVETSNPGLINWLNKQARTYQCAVWHIRTDPVTATQTWAVHPYFLDFRVPMGADSLESNLKKDWEKLYQEMMVYL